MEPWKLKLLTELLPDITDSTKKDKKPVPTQLLQSLLGPEDYNIEQN